MNWARVLAYVTGTVDQELLLRNEYLATENRILKAQLKGRLRLSDAERATLGEIAHRLGRKVLGEVANVARPDTILAWYRKLVARKFDGSKARRGPGRPRTAVSRKVSGTKIFWETKEFGPACRKTTFPSSVSVVCGHAPDEVFGKHTTQHSGAWRA
jgi:hypothetical protein